MDAPPPNPPPPVPPPTPSPQPPIILPPPRMGCFAKGCLSVLIIGCVLFGLALACGWYVLHQITHNFTSTQPAQIEVVQPTEPEIQAANGKLDSLRAAARENRETAVEFTASDLNTLIANNPDFRELRGRARVGIANSLMTVDLSVPLHGSRWLKNRWFNGHIEFGFNYSDGDVNIDLRSLEANGHHLPRKLQGTEFSHTFWQTFNDRFAHDTWRRHPDDEELARHVKSAAIANDKLVVTTRHL